MNKTKLICNMKSVSQYTGKPVKETLTVEKTETTIQITDSEGTVLVSHAPFFNGGSIWLSDFNDINMDKDHWKDDKDGKYVKDWTQPGAISNVSTSQILSWKEDSEKLAKIREAQRIVNEVSE